MPWQGRGGQHTAEFSLLIGMTALIAVTMQPIVRRVLRRGVQTTTDVVLQPVLMWATPQTLNVDPDDPRSSGSVTLRWDVPVLYRRHNPCESCCTASGGWSGQKSATGEEQIDGVARETTFRLSCQFVEPIDGGVVTIPAEVTVGIGSLNARAEQRVDMQGKATEGFRTTVTDAVSGTAVNQDVQTRQLPKE